MSGTSCETGCNKFWCLLSASLEFILQGYFLNGNFKLFSLSVDEELLHCTFTVALHRLWIKLEFFSLTPSS